MTKTIQPPHSTLANDCITYLPIRDFIQKMGQAEEANPYSSTFSFMPFIKKMKENKKLMRRAVGAVDTAFVKEIEKKLVEYSDPKQLDTPEKIQEVVAMLFPSLFFDGQLGFVAKPFTKEFFYMTPALQDIFSSNDWEVKIAGQLTKGKMNSPAIEAGKLILNTFYNKAFDSSTYQIMTFRHRETKLERHFRVNVILDFIKTTPKKKLQILDVEQIHNLCNEWDNEAYWLKQFPAKDFSFEGLVIGYIEDVTTVEVLSRLKELMMAENTENVDSPAQTLERLTNMIRSYLQMPDIVFGDTMKPDFKYAASSTWSLLGGPEEIATFTQEDLLASPIYGQVIQQEEPVIIGDLQAFEQRGKVEEQLLRKGYRSLLIVPQKESNGGELIGVFELASAQPYRLNKQVLDKLGEMLSLFSVGASRWIQGMDNKINLFIQEQFTYIHPSVEWKFQEVSQQFVFSSSEKDAPPTLAPIVFKNVYPLYGQADIVGSSKIRNRSIEADMLDNLQRVQKVIRAFRKRLPFQLLDIYQASIQAFIKRLENGGYVSSDESQIVELLVGEIHPLLRNLKEQYAQLPNEVFKKYFAYLDPKLDIVYRKRKAYEDSVHALNELISRHIDKEVAIKQEVLPHFFEKYATDGVEYNIYLGQSILPNKEFNYYFLKDFRLWQLMLMCTITRLVEKNKDNLLVPLSTAQLIFVYNTQLSISFNMDEKQFDVDGAYNVRYEILKKRIDKAVIKGTNERLTQKGKVAIVWLQEKDRVEYLEYIHHLLREGYITDDIEELELERLQGADGLKALRVTVAM